MCGICGIIYHEKDQQVKKGQLTQMRDSLIHRGPDDAGIYIDQNMGIGSRRLSILDLSSNGHMPMSTPDQRFWIVHNGEIYNYRELRSTLKSKGVHFHSETDTEVLLHLYRIYGPQMLDMCNGMFAFAIWDGMERTLFLARDRMGIKPLYYAVNTEGLYFSSEEKAIFAAGITAQFDESCVAELTFFRYVAGERTPYHSVKRLLPGHYLLYQDGKVVSKRWYNLSEKIDPNSIRINKEKLIEQFLELFDDSVRLRLVSDVPVGALLSGGLDSGGMAASMAQQSDSQISTFTVRFEDEKYDEGVYAKELAEKYSLDYQEFYLSHAELPEMLRQSTYLLDEPLMHGHDPHLLAISRMAKKKVSVLLSGEGADEIMAGYVRYLFFRNPQWLMNILGALPNTLKRTQILPRRLYKTAQLLQFKSGLERLVYSSAELFPHQFNMQGDQDLDYRYNVAEESQRTYKDPLRQVMYYEQHTYLQSLMDRNDRMTMGASIECREPFLDYRLVEWSANLPSEFLYEKGIGKAVMRYAMKNRLPKSILNHPKWGFGVPWHTYLRKNPELLKKTKALASGQLKTRLISNHIVEKAAQLFLNGNDNFLPLVRQYIFFDIWQEVCL